MLPDDGICNAEDSRGAAPCVLMRAISELRTGAEPLLVSVGAGTDVDLTRVTLALDQAAARSSAISRRISASSVLGTATSAIWKAKYRPWLTTFAPILISFSFQARQRPVRDRLGRRERAQEVAEVIGQGVKL